MSTKHWLATYGDRIPSGGKTLGGILPLERHHSVVEQNGAISGLRNRAQDSGLVVTVGINDRVR